MESEVDVKSQGDHVPTFWANIIEHKLPIVGKYFYIPHWPEARILNFKFSILDEVVNLARKNNIGWIRIEPSDSHALDLIRANWRITKAPHNMQPREILVIDISKPEEQLLSEMKPKTRYNIRIAQKKKVEIIESSGQQVNDYIDEFVRLVRITSARDKIVSHPAEHYRKMFEVLNSDIISLYSAQYGGNIIAANIVIFFGDTAIYLHGASDNKYRNVMAPYLLQWQAILDAKKQGIKFYDFGGIRMSDLGPVTSDKSWAGITRFKIGFSPKTEPVIFPGSYDIVLNPARYNLYRIIQKIKNFI